MNKTTGDGKVVKRFKNVGEFRGKVTTKKIPMTVFKRFHWRTSFGAAQFFDETVQKIWKGSPIPNREFCDVARVHIKLFSPTKTGKYHSDIESWHWTIEFGQTLNPIIRKAFSGVLSGLISGNIKKRFAETDIFILAVCDEYGRKKK